MYFEKDKIREKNKLYKNIKESALGSYEEYYYSFCTFMVFILGAFAFYTGTRISKGLFLLLDLFICYKIVKNFIEFKKYKKLEEFPLENKMKFLNKTYKYVIIFLTEAIIRHFLTFNIVIWTYIKIIVIAYGIVFFAYKILGKKMKAYYLERISANEYDKIISWKKFKHKMFVVFSFLMFMMVVISTMMKLIKGTNFVIVLTIIYTLLIFIALEIKCDLEVEEAILFDDEIFDFSVPAFIDVDDLDNYEMETPDNDLNLGTTGSYENKTDEVM